MESVRISSQPRGLGAPTSSSRACARPTPSVRSSSGALRRPSTVATPSCCEAAQADHIGDAQPLFGRRQLLGAQALLPLLLLRPGGSWAAGDEAAPAGLEVISDSAGFGQHAVRQGDLVLLHYVGTLEATGAVFDSTRGGDSLRYLDGGRGVLRPVAFRLSGFAQPGLCEGLQQAVVGMTVGGRRSVRVPPQLGFGAAAVRAPYAEVPANSALFYDIELLRVSALGPDALMKGISQCSAGGASASAANCGDIEPAEFF